MMKKAILLLLVMVAAIGLASVPAFAHGGHGRGYGGHGRGYGACARTEYEACAVQECAQIGLHEHDGEWYTCANHDAGDCGEGRCHYA